MVVTQALRVAVKIIEQYAPIIRCAVGAYRVNDCLRCRRAIARATRTVRERNDQVVARLDHTGAILPISLCGRDFDSVGEPKRAHRNDLPENRAARAQCSYLDWMLVALPIRRDEPKTSCLVDACGRRAGRRIERLAHGTDRARASDREPIHGALARNSGWRLARSSA